MAAPTIPRISPMIEAKNEKKFRKKVEGTIWISMEKGRAIPRIDNRKPIRIMLQGRIWDH